VNLNPEFSDSAFTAALLCPAHWVGGGGASAPPKALICPKTGINLWKSGQNPWNVGKIYGNVRKIPEIMDKLPQNTDENGAQRRENQVKTLRGHPKMIWVWGNTHTKSCLKSFRASLGKCEQNISHPQKFACSFTYCMVQHTVFHFKSYQQRVHVQWVD